jgi:hypothetical protein
LALLDCLSSKGKTALISTLSSSWLSLHSSLDLTGHGQESLLNIGGSLGGSFKELNSQRVGKFLALFGRDNALARQIGLVTNQQFVDVFCCVSIDFMKPLLDIVERFLVGNVINNNNSVGTTVIRRCNRTESLLSGGIPNLKLDGLSIQFNGANFLTSTFDPSPWNRKSGKQDEVSFKDRKGRSEHEMHGSYHVQNQHQW